MYAVWSYDSFPFFLCAKVAGEPDSRGAFALPTYGPGFRVVPNLLVSDETGKKLNVKIDKLRRDMSVVVDEFKRTSRDEIETLLGRDLPSEIRRHL